MERINKLYVIIGLAIAYCLFFGVIANADESDEATTLSFSAPVEIPGEVLPAGTYLFKVADNGSDPNVVEIFNSEGTKLYRVVQTVPTERPKPTDDTAMTLAEQRSGKPDILLKWFYPGRVTGNEFLYSGSKAKALAQDEHYTVLAGSHPSDSAAWAGER